MYGNWNIVSDGERYPVGHSTSGLSLMLLYLML